MKKCTAERNYITVATAKTISDVTTIERKTKKMIFNDYSKNKLLKTRDLLVPSIVNGSYCDINYSTYYFIPKNVYDKSYKYSDYRNLKIRIRHYHFLPGIFFEVKFTGVKIRVEIDPNYNILSNYPEEEKYKKLLNNLLELMRSGKTKVLCTTKYKRFSYVYYYDKTVRITLDTEIEYNSRRYDNLNILEIKYPLDSNTQIVEDIINRCRKLNLKQTHVRKSLLPNYLKIN
jgi:hypothetical protein